MPLTLRIKLAGINDPRVWRKLTVPGQFTFYTLHLLIQEAFVWNNEHLYSFTKGTRNSNIVIHEMDADEFWHTVLNSHTTPLSHVLNTVKQKYMYIYDFGDNWKHIITISKIEDLSASNADCVAGQGVCPPENCGSPWGYTDIKEVLANPRHKAQKDKRERMGMKRGQQ